MSEQGIGMISVAFILELIQFEVARESL